MTYKITLADNGYIVEYEDGEFLSVYQGEEPSKEMCSELLGELLGEIVQGTSSQYEVEVTVKPLDRYKFDGKEKKQ